MAKLILKDFQEVGVDFIYDREYTILADTMGLGKTIEIIGLIKKIEEEEWKPSVTIFCPAYLQFNWRREIRKWLPNYSVEILKSKDLDRLDSVDIAIVSYGILHSYSSSFNRDLVACDEAHYLKNSGSRRGKSAIKFVKEEKPNRLVLATGTPVTSQIKDFYSLLLMTDHPKHNFIALNLYRSEFSFCREFMRSRPIKVKGRVINKWYGSKNEEKLKAILKDRYIRRTTKQVLDLPELQEKTLQVTELAKGLSDELAKSFENYQLNGTILATGKRKSALAKVKACAEYVLDLLEKGSGPLVVFSDHPEVVHKLKDSLSSKKVRIGTIVGGDSPEDKDKVEQAFTNGELDVFAGTIGSASTGLTLTVSNFMIFNDWSWTPANNDQAKKRIHRISQERDSSVVYLVSGEVDEMILENVRLKSEATDKVVSKD